MMEHLDILIPMSPERFLPQVVLDHLLIQNIRFRLFFSNVKGDGAASARNFVKDMWQQSLNKSEFCLMTDNDICLPEGSVQAMINFLNQNSDFGAIGLKRNGAPEVPDTEAVEPPHISAGPVLFRSSIFEQITYHNNDGCECQGQSNDVRNLGSRIGFLGGWTYDHIDRTKRDDLINPEPNLPHQEEIDSSEGVRVNEEIVIDENNEEIPVSQIEETNQLNCIQIGIDQSAEYTYLVGCPDSNDSLIWKPPDYNSSPQWDYYGVDANPLCILDWNKKQIPQTKWINVFLAKEAGIAETFEIGNIRSEHVSELGNNLYIGKITLSQLIRNLGLNNIEILVMDIEGYELEVFYEYDWQIKPRYLIVETHSNQTCEALCQLFRNHGYNELEKRLTNNESTTEIIFQL